jgi:Carboxypeptidase regulatory-like domain
MKKLIGMMAFVVVVSGSAWAQTVAVSQISGTAKDSSGAVLPGVEIKATQTETGVSRMTITDETGTYALPNLAVGPYRFEASLAGFSTYIQTGIVLQVNSNPAINVVLQVGGLAETIEVKADVAMVETRSTGVGQVIDNQRVLEMPLNGRNLANPYGKKTADNYLNPAAFALPAAGTLGTMGAASIEGPRYWQFDFALSRVFRFGEVRRVEFRAEDFNVFNAVRLNDPVTNLNSGNFGQITSARDPRIMQFALKYVF